MNSRSAGFSLVELMIAMTIMLVISGAAVTALLKLSTTQSTIWNRTQMHSGIRGATEVLQQEVGQAGRITLPSPVTLTSGPALGATSLTVSSSSGMFAGEKLTLGAGTNQETVTVSADPTSSTSVSISATTASHPSGDSLSVQGGFSAGIV
ncbi:MAG TPA: prepilin-type N-terminal cleavage/methylation domain-containing protein, partial [Vicinamibacterales bacterium]|nr:prepilin-type N-terminal cleavage/methylation domain-containing protein [Vicinamibacterales bacterium]